MKQSKAKQSKQAKQAGRQEQQQQQMEDVCIWVLRRQKSAEIVKDCKTYYCHCKISVSSLLLPSCLSSSWRIALKSSMLQLSGFFQEREELLQSPQCCCSSMGISKSLKNCSKVLNGLFQELQRIAPHPECCCSMVRTFSWPCFDGVYVYEQCVHFSQMLANNFMYVTAEESSPIASGNSQKLISMQILCNGWWSDFGYVQVYGFCQQHIHMCSFSFQEKSICCCCVGCV